MSSPYFEGDKALERLGDLTERICRVAEGNKLDRGSSVMLEYLLGEMGRALRERDLERARKLVTSLLCDVLGYDKVRAKFVMNNHLNKNAGWD